MRNSTNKLRKTNLWPIFGSFLIFPRNPWLKKVQMISRIFHSLVFNCLYLQFGSSWYQVVNSLLIPIILINFKRAGTVTSLDFKPCNILCNNSVLLPWSLLSLVLIEKARLEMIQLQGGDFSDQQGIPHSHQAYQQKRAAQAGLKLKIPKGMCVCVCVIDQNIGLFLYWEGWGQSITLLQ